MDNFSFPLHRQSSVEDLKKLAKQFDENMQQDKETSEQLNSVNNNLNETLNTSFHNNVKELKCSSSSGRMEAELHALFDCSTQAVSGRLSQSSSASACSTLAEPQQSEPRSSNKSSSAANPGDDKGSHGVGVTNCDDFDDDWENDLLNDSLVLAMTQNTGQQLDTNLKSTMHANTTQVTSVCKPSANINSAHRPSTLPSSSALWDLCPKPKTTNRSTFKLESNPRFQPKTAAREFSNLNVIQSKSQMSDMKPATTKTRSAPQPDKIPNDQRGAGVATVSAKDPSDSLWDDGDDDALLYQVCDRVERLSNSQPQQVSLSSCQEKQDVAVDRQRKTTVPVPIDTAWSVNAGASANRQSPRAFVRSHSLPSTSCETVNYQGWNIPMKGANNESQMSPSLPASKCWDSSRTFQDRNANMDTNPHTVMARAPHKAKSHHTAFKRNVSDSAAVSNKGKLPDCIWALLKHLYTLIWGKSSKCLMMLLHRTVCLVHFRII